MSLRIAGPGTGDRIPSMNERKSSTPTPAAGVAAAAAIPVALLHVLTGETRRGQGLSAAPFGAPSLLVAHLA